MVVVVPYRNVHYSELSVFLKFVTIFVAMVLLNITGLGCFSCLQRRGMDC